MIDENLLEALSSAPDDETLHDLIEAHGLDTASVAELKKQSASLYFDRPAEALRIARVARCLGSLLPDPAPALGRWALANAFLFTERFQEAAALFDLVRADYLALDRPLDAARMGVGHVWALAYTGQLERALDLAAEIEPVLAEAAVEDPDDRRRLGGLYNNVGIAHELLGQYEEALAAYDRKLTIARDQENGLDVARTQHNRACALTYLNVFDEALEAFREAEVGFHEADVTADLARLSYNRGTLYAQWGRYQEAETEFSTAAEWLQQLEETDQARAALITYRALAHLESGECLDEALLERVIKAQTVLAAHGPPFEEGLSWLALGRHYLAVERLSVSEEAFERALEIAEESSSSPLIWEALHYLGVLSEQLGDTDTALKRYERAIEEIEAMRRDLYVEAFRAGFLADKLEVYGDLVLLYTRLGRLDRAFATVERAKSRLLAERLVGRLTEEVSDLAAGEASHLQALASRLREALADLEDLHRQARIGEGGERGEAWTIAPTGAIQEAVQQLEQEVRTLTRQMERERPFLSTLVLGESASLQALRGRLGQTGAERRAAVLLQYHIAGERIYVFVVDGAGIQEHYDLASLAAVEEARRRFSAAVERVLGLTVHYGRDIPTRYLPALLADADAHLSTLYDLLINPLASHFSRRANLVVSPAGSLHYVPFHALYDGSSYLIEHHSVSYTPSATVLDLCAGHETAGQGMLIVGYGGERLAQVAVEVETMADIFPQADLLSGEAATTKRLLRDAPGCRILHLATHARFRADSAMLSSFSLADRRLTLAEIARLHLRADLVTLSGCETGRGRLYGADLISLAGGFLGAGARSLLVSLWRVDDPVTSRLMESFYRELRRGTGRAAALRRAQLQLLALGREQPEAKGFYRHPAYWAPFIMIGDWGELPGLSPQEQGEDECVG